jgi:hypothetical protein
MHICILDFGTILKDRLKPHDQPYSTARNPQKGQWLSQVGRGPPYQSSYVVDYKALTGLSLMWVPKQSVRLGAPRAWTMPPTPYCWLCLGPSAAVIGKRPPRGMYSHYTGFHCIDDPPDMGPYIQQDNI